ncbi:MAG TPA: sulfotransferase domain-containing protein [Caulobacteraceae bacterium]|nr:sulfotransferase domain-containing protein [Caulobacteraceae bacterium]
MSAFAEGPRRARNMEEFAAIQGRMATPRDYAAGLAGWKPRPTDIVIAPFGKCGTTWLQQTFHTLRTAGDMDFDDISRVTPWIETAAIVGIDLEAPQRAEPRGFKSHLPFDMLPRGAKGVVSLRDPKDALVSMYRFMEGWFIEPGAVSITEFARPRIERPEDPRSYWSHLLSWWEQRDSPNVMLLSYEYMTDEPEETIRRLAAFAGLPLDAALLKLTLERSSLAFMLEHKDRFDDFLMRRVSETRGGLPPGSDSAKVRKGGVGGHVKELPPDLAAEMDAIWTRVVTPRTGFANYAELDAALRARVA